MAGWLAGRSPTRWGAACAIALLAASLAACGDDKAPVAKATLPVETETAVLTPVTNTVSLTGEVRARVESDLSFRVAGRIATRLVDVGDTVAAGQVLATLETTEQAAEVASATAGVQSAEATLRQATSAFDRQKELMKSGFTTQSSYDNASQALTAADSALKTAQANLSTAQQQLGYTELRADAAGTITTRNAETGQVVEAAQAVFTLAHDGARDAVFDIDEALLTDELKDKTLSISLLSNPAVHATGKVREVAPTIDSTTGTLRIKLAIQDPPPEMGLGTSVVGVGRFQSREVVTFPWQAFFSSGDSPAVWVLDPASRTVSLRPVVIDSYRSGKFVLRGGIAPGESVVTAGAQLLRPGQVVDPRPAEGQAL
ncbi:RND family efflux transporter MFP subunit [Angulomicrobium tetraedrale]|uniref:RND family efflux transporter MFP subunit n=1 Tax=Ancylobacter tetraedralis TaxID=217068 RepID=A0A839Z9L4_9HYPH|nr:efflux RND transporter periplasmic adaptor subunit [Ancylobacter tetraedralis]MBB3771307.1 RND family efflux transporter MFP subunit [Ancylobacter tetraedralis]